MNTENEKILFICEGNVGRSQMAEGFWNHWFSGNSAISAGTDNVGKKYNFQPREDIILAMSERGVDISVHKIKQLAKEMLHDITTIVVLCEKNLLTDFIITSGLNIIYRQVADPYESSMDDVRQIRDEIESILLKLASLENRFRL
jgi:arsenate reductase (thioredoxin)